jgi:hypothetical protein
MFTHPYVRLQWSAYGTRYNGPTNGFRSFLHTDAGKYLVSLLVADLWHALGYASGLHWLITGKVELGKACNFQGVCSQLSYSGAFSEGKFLSHRCIFRAW